VRRPGAVIIRPLAPERDLEGYLRVMHQADPFSHTADDWREREKLAPPGAFRRHLVGELDGEIVAAAAVVDHPMIQDGVTVRLVVDVAHRRRGHGRTLAAAVEALVAERAPAEVEVRVRDDDAGSRAWAERRGFRLRSHMVRSRLELAEFDPEPHRHIIQRAEAAGLRFMPPDDLDRLYVLYAGLVVETPDHLAPPSQPVFRRLVEGRPGMVRLIACDGPTWVGLAIVERMGPDGAWNDFTGVLAAYRGRGLARALKVLATEAVARQGRRWIETTNNVGNAAMLAVNRSLGYRPVSGILFLRRRP
jgi:GNAT superfamily N-acetyltransferase